MKNWCPPYWLIFSAMTCAWMVAALGFIYGQGEAVLPEKIEIRDVQVSGKDARSIRVEFDGPKELAIACRRNAVADFHLWERIGLASKSGKVTKLEVMSSPSTGRFLMPWVLVLADGSESMDTSCDAPGRVSRSAWLEQSILADLDSSFAKVVAFDDTVSHAKDRVSDHGSEQKTPLNPFEAMDQGWKWIKDKNGPKYIFIFTDGYALPKSDAALHQKASLIQKIKSARDSSSAFYAISLGSIPLKPDTLSALQDLVKELGGIQDSLLMGFPYFQIADFVLDRLVPEKLHYALTYETAWETWDARERFVRMALMLPSGDSIPSEEVGLQYGTSHVTIQARSSFPWLPFSILLLLVLLIVPLRTHLIPALHDRQFRRQYVVKYASLRQAKVSHHDAIDTLPLEDGDDVVVKCRHWMRWDSWTHSGHRCPDYPSLCKDGVQDRPASGIGNFFRQIGSNKYYCFALLGALGGLMGWGLFEILEVSGDIMDAATWCMAGTMDWLTPQVFDAGAFAHALLLGMATGLCLGLGLAVASVLGHPGHLGWGRILAKVAIAFVGFTTIHLAAGLLYFTVLREAGLLGIAFEWCLMGVLMGAVLTWQSGMEMEKGMAIGLVAGGAGLLVFLLLMQFMAHARPALALGVAYTLIGGLLHILFVWASRRITQYKIGYVLPVECRGLEFPIGGTLKSGRAVVIGTNPETCTIRIKRTDLATGVLPEHCTLTEMDNKVWITPLGPLQVNGVLCSQRTALSSLSTISLGDGGVEFQLTFRYESGSPKARIGQDSDNSGIAKVKIKEIHHG